MVLDRYQHISFFDKPRSLPQSARRGLQIDPLRNESIRESPALEPETAAFCAWLLETAGLELNSYRGVPLARRLRACLRSLRVRSIAEARVRLQKKPEQVDTALNALLIGVTEFVRDFRVFDYLEEFVLPELSAHRPGLRVWSAGCADGAELYSVAFLLARHGLLGASYLVGTDCRADAVAKASAGWFDEHSPIARLAPALREAYFVRERGGWRVGEELRRATHWEWQDVLEAGPATAVAWDLILCRNVAIYLHPAASTALWDRLAGSLRTGGCLVVGKAERPEGRRRLLRVAPCVYQKRRGGGL